MSDPSPRRTGAVRLPFPARRRPRSRAGADDLPFAVPRIWTVVAAVSLLAYLALAASRPGQMWWLGDLRVYRAGGSAAWDGGRDLYELSVGAARLPFTYTPWAALGFGPLAWMPLGAAETLGVVLNLVLLYVAAHLSWGLAGVTSPGTRRAASAVTAAALLWTEPVQETLRFGQINLLVMCLVLYDFSRPAGDRRTGVGIGIAAGIKLTPAFFGLYLLATGRARAAFTALGTFAATVAIGLVFLPEASRRYWGEMLFLDTSRVGPLEWPGNQSLRGALARVMGDPDPSVAVWLPLTAAVGVVGVVSAVLLRRRAMAPGTDERTRRQGELAGLSVTALTGLLIAPISWSHHWVWIVPGAVLLAGAAHRVHASRWRRSALLAGAGAVPAVMLAIPGERVELPKNIPTGIIWNVPYRSGRELDLAFPDLLLSNAYVILGLTLLLLSAATATPTRR
ncbi:glycosyltransferase 87 family protein [Yinghuangia sp. ASG 101]|uniref:glycosyltransferase 87 family protein n=1 Tax=Yinghuangia sp. ASG 101 TaxID=2896848 RepID=UPI001E56DA77|nr:glycosyltransferase 87 family protein [Yinghuangia sp. ASG 101]UGQ12172.1 glycosyltransferase 87 family protein [Yinghuangia sp. ASG 101]